MSLNLIKPPPKRDLALDPNRKSLAAAIVLHAGAVRDLQVAEQASTLASEHLWKAQAHLEELRKKSAAPSGARAEHFIASVGAGKPCGVDVLERASVNSHALIAASEIDIRVWQGTWDECCQAVYEKNSAVADAKERIEKAARMVICNEDAVTHLVDDLAALQSEIIKKRSVLRFIYRSGLNGELSAPLEEQSERLLRQDLTSFEPTPASRAWQLAFEQLMEDSDAALPS